MFNSLIIFCAKYLFIIIVLIAVYVMARLPRAKRKQAFIWAILAAVIALILTKAAAALYFDPRPFTHGITPLFTHDADNGFPSDHMVVTMVAAVMSYTYNKRIGAGLVVLSLIVGISRILSGIHNPLDILAGIAIAVVSVYSSRIFLKIPRD